MDKNIKKFTLKGDGITSELILSELNEISVKFKYSYSDSTNSICFTIQGEAVNIDPEGMMKLDELNPIDDGNGGTAYSYELNKTSLLIFVPFKIKGAKEYVGVKADYFEGDKSIIKNINCVLQ